MSEAQRPEGWPEITPVGKVELKERPAFRVAVAEASSGTGGEGRLFGTLFRHIQDRDIPMTAPVTMTRSSEGQMQSMGFLYENLDVGSTGEAGGAEVQDRPSATVVSTGLRGGYSAKSYANGLGDCKIISRAGASSAHWRTGVHGIQQPLCAWIPEIRGVANRSERAASGRVARQVTAGPCPLEVESSDSAINIQDFSAQVQSGRHFGLHRLPADFRQRDTAHGDFGMVPSAVAFKSERAWWMVVRTASRCAWSAGHRRFGPTFQKDPTRRRPNDRGTVLAAKTEWFWPRRF